MTRRRKLVRGMRVRGNNLLDEMLLFQFRREEPRRIKLTLHDGKRARSRGYDWGYVLQCKKGNCL